MGRESLKAGNRRNNKMVLDIFKISATGSCAWFGVVVLVLVVVVVLVWYW